MSILHLVVAAAVALATGVDGRLRLRVGVASWQMCHCSLLGFGNFSQPVGCLSDVGGNRGRVVWRLDELAALAAGEPAIVVLSLPEFGAAWRSDFAQFAAAPAAVKGTIVLLNSLRPELNASGLAELVRCAFRDTDAQCRTRKLRDSLALRSPVPFPVVFVPNSTIQAALGASVQHISGTSSSLWAELRYTKSFIVNSGCLLRQRSLWSAAVGRMFEMALPIGQRCQLVQGTSLVWTAAGAGVRSRGTGSTLLIVTRMDAFSVFSNWGSGAAQLHPSLTVVLAIVHWLTDCVRAGELTLGNRDVVFLLLSGEAYGLSASRAVAGQLADDADGLYLGDGVAPLRLRHLDGILEVGTLNWPQRSELLVQEPDPTKPLWPVAAGTQLRVTSMTGQYPADSSVRSFHDAIARSKKWKPTALLTDAGECPGCGGFADTRSPVKVGQLATLVRKVADGVAKFLEQAGARGAVARDNMQLRTSRLFACFRLAADCSELFDGAFVRPDGGGSGGGGGGGTVGNLRRWLATGVAADLSGGGVLGQGAIDTGESGEVQPMLAFLETLLLQLTGQREAVEANGECPAARGPAGSYLLRLRNGSQYCVRSRLTPISAPALSSSSSSSSSEYGDADAGDPTTATWVTASQKEFPTVSFYAKPPEWREWLTLAIGLAVLLLSCNAAYSLRPGGRAAATVFPGNGLGNDQEAADSVGAEEPQQQEQTV